MVEELIGWASLLWPLAVVIPIALLITTRTS